jgi:hypothetical protein
MVQLLAREAHASIDLALNSVNIALDLYRRMNSEKITYARVYVEHVACVLDVVQKDNSLIKQLLRSVLDVIKESSLTLDSVTSRHFLKYSSKLSNP